MSAGPKATTSITITMLSGVGAGPFTINVPTAVADIKDGFAPCDDLIRSIFVRGGFWDPASGVFYTIFQIASISTT